MKLHQVIDGTFSISAVWPEGLVCESVPVMGSWGQTIWVVEWESRGFEAQVLCCFKEIETA